MGLSSTHIKDPHAVGKRSLPYIEPIFLGDARDTAYRVEAWRKGFPAKYSKRQWLPATRRRQEAETPRRRVMFLDE